MFTLESVLSGKYLMVFHDGQKNLWDDIISALEGLLKAESEQVYRVAVEPLC